MGTKALTVKDAMTFMQVCRAKTERDGGFQQQDLYSLRGYQVFCTCAKNLGYVEYYNRQFHWVSQSITNVMAELMIREHSSHLEKRRKTRALLAREETINELLQEDSLPVMTNVVDIDTRRNTPRPMVLKPIKRSWLARLFFRPPDMTVYEILNSNLIMLYRQNERIEQKLNKLIAEWVGESAE